MKVFHAVRCVHALYAVRRMHAHKYTMQCFAYTCAAYTRKCSLQYVYRYVVYIHCMHERVYCSALRIHILCKMHFRACNACMSCCVCNSFVHAVYIRDALHAMHVRSTRFVGNPEGGQQCIFDLIILTIFFGRVNTNLRGTKGGTLNPDKSSTACTRYTACSTLRYVVSVCDVLHAATPCRHAVPLSRQIWPLDTTYEDLGPFWLLCYTVAPPKCQVV